MNTTNKESIYRLVEFCRAKKIENVIFSPGSRNAPLVIAFHATQTFNIVTIPDERVAAFYALGQALESRKPSIICCTSGSAVLNYAPAIVEAYYQRVPLLILTADRPGRKIDQGIGQSMRQNKVYENYIKKSYTWIEEASSSEDLKTNDTIIQDAIELTSAGIPGPVHINIPFEEPLYDQVPYQKLDLELTSSSAAINSEAENNALNLLRNKWPEAERKMVICGQMTPGSKLGYILAELAAREDIVLLTETTSNIESSYSVQSIDRVLHRLDKKEGQNSDLLIHMGGPIVSKKIKQFIKHNPPAEHWHIDLGSVQDTFDTSPHHIQQEPSIIMADLLELNSSNEESYLSEWRNLSIETSVLHSKYLEQIPFCDLIVFDVLLSSIPEESIVHLANSTPVRYAQLFDQRPNLSFQSNRGVSGIDGSTSTALGVASLSKQRNILITGDMSFFYDSNAFWQTKQALPQLLIFLINNGGGGIFRYIKGPDTTEQIEDVFASAHELDASKLCDLYSIDYTSVHSQVELEKTVATSFKTESCCVVEIFTSKELNSKLLRAYFEYMSEDLK